MRGTLRGMVPSHAALPSDSDAAGRFRFDVDAVILRHRAQNVCRLLPLALWPSAARLAVEGDVLGRNAVRRQPDRSSSAVSDERTDLRACQESRPVERADCRL